MALGKKVKTLLLTSGPTSAVANAVEWANAVDSVTFQDDVRVIGVQVGVLPGIIDSALNADQQCGLMGEVSRHGVANSPGLIARASWFSAWTAAIVVPGNGEVASLMFPDGHGIDFDDGEGIYLHTYVKHVGTVGIYYEIWAIVHYVER